MIEIERLDARDDTLLAAAYATIRAGATWGRPHADVPPWQMFLAWVRSDDAPWQHRFWVAREGGGVVAVASLIWSRYENAGVCEAHVSVPGPLRRRGHGTALSEHVLDEARTAGRHTVEAEIVHAATDPAPAGVAFATRLGFEQVMYEHRSRLALPVPAARLEALATAARPHHDAYSLRTWRGRCPVDLVQPFCDLLAEFDLEAPHGDRVVERAPWDVARLASQERARAAQGITAWTCAALAPTGQPVGYTELLFAAGDDTVHQAATLVGPGHRGHRLGIAMKVANLQALDSSVADAVTTYVAPDNAAMQDVNRALGYEVVEHLVCVQRRL